MNEIWILGATGRSGRAVAAQLASAQLASAQFAPVLVGRDMARLQQVAATIGGDFRIVAADSVEAMARAIAEGKPAVVINTIGPFTLTALPIFKACAPGTHYVDISNELASFIEMFSLHDEAVAAGQTVVMGAGFGVLATESIVLKLCAARPPAHKVRVDVLPFVEVEAGTMGAALAGTIVGGMVEGGRRYSRGELVRARPASDVQTLSLPDGSRVTTAGWSSGELVAARRASGAGSVVAASSMMPNSPIMGAVLPPLMALMQVKAVSDFATRRLAAVEIKPGQYEGKGQQFSWAHARVSWASGDVREGWLQLGDAGEFTTNVLAEVALRLARGEGKLGAYTPGALFGPELAEVAGGEFLL